MPLYQIISMANLAIVCLSLVVLVRLLATGALSEKQLRLGPTRDLDQPMVLYALAVMGVLLYSGLKLVVIGAGQMTALLAIELMGYAIIGLTLVRASMVEAGLRKIGLVPRWPGRDAAWGLLGGVVGLGLAGSVGLLVNFISTYLGQPVDPIAHDALVKLHEQFSVELLLNLIISAVIMAPLIEELIYRGVLQTSLLRLFKGNRWPALLVASFVFAVIHYTVVPWQGLIPLFVLGLVFGYVYERTGSLLTPILAHATFNAASIGITLCMPEQLPQ